MNDSTEASQVLPLHASVKAVLSTLLCFFFLYVNSVMVFALLKKPVLLQSPRYVLFGHLLVTDSLQLVGTMLLYVLALTRIRMVSYVCITFVLIATSTVKLSPLNLAIMSLERYVAVCFPLRHPNIATSRTMGLAIAVIWTVASLDSFMLLIVFFSLENTSFILQKSCVKSAVFRLQIYFTLNKIFTVVYFALVSVIIIYTYISIMITAKSASSNASKASKAHKTMLLHLLQFCLCLTSTLFNMINTSGLLKMKRIVAVHIQYVFFLFLIILPKCLSPLLYGLRDQTFRHVFINYFTFGFKTRVTPSPKS
ncbi:olfactory receptor 2T1 [Stegastes partitus]|uniref:Olfactory receptor 2T1 n=2 Tax=Stegastes partitus TaxID=144197 RepID=A0A9Y4K5E0_9TELE|nr:PREDICTED: olfactory receptor 2T1-like [Stegastes partitus]